MFFDLLCGFFFVFPLHFKSWTVSGEGPYISLAHSWFSLFIAMLYCYFCRNNLILLGLFWVVCHPSKTYLPKGLGQEPQNRSFPLSPPPNHTSFTSYLWPMAPPRPILAGYRLMVHRPCACFPFRYVQESACCSCVCRDLGTLRLYFLTFYVGFSLVFRSIQELGFV